MIFDDNRLQKDNTKFNLGEYRKSCVNKSFRDKI